MLHPRVHVQAVGFHKWKYFWLGIIVTPWCMNVILAKGQPSKWKSIPRRTPPALSRSRPGCMIFISVKDRILGEYQMCSLMSPLEEVVSDHEMAVEIAKAALEELMKPETGTGTPASRFPPFSRKSTRKPSRKRLKQHQSSDLASFVLKT